MEHLIEAIDEMCIRDRIYTCGPKPMMMAVAKYAKSNQIECEVSLENTMACGIGACYRLNAFTDVNFFHCLIVFLMV